MSITVKEVTDKSGLRTFIQYPHRLYKHHPCFTPPLQLDEEGTLRWDKNPAFDYCDARYWLAYKEDKVVGRIAGILNKAYIQKWGRRYIRFGWLDFEDDERIAKALIKKVEEWGKSLYMQAVHGPLGFTDLDHEGLLVEGFDQPGTIAALYNHAYYPALLEKAGYRKDTDWLEYTIRIPEKMDGRLEKLASIVQRRQNLKAVQLRKTKDVLPYVPAIFDLLNTAYADLYGVVPLTEKQIRYYTKQYFSFIHPDFISLITDSENKLAAFSITMPSLSKALQKANGRLFPLGFYYLLKALKKNNRADLLLIAVRKDLQGKGVNAMLMYETLKAYIKKGITVAEASHQLEDNMQVQAMWDYFDASVHKRRRCYIKYLDKQ
jgi:GNAT superfamily N-acetyltransferase